VRLLADNRFYRPQETLGSDRQIQRIADKAGHLDKKLSNIIRDLEEYRNNSDYTKGFRATKAEAEECAGKAKIFFEAAKKYTDNWLKENNS
jgi:uncharacterized protein (UPF0332 family)